MKFILQNDTSERRKLQEIISKMQGKKSIPDSEISSAFNSAFKKAESIKKEIAKLENDLKPLEATIQDFWSAKKRFS